MNWLLFVLGAVLSWGMYGPILHKGQVALGNPLRALLCVGVAYFLIGVLVPVLMLAAQGQLGGFNLSGSITATVAGALGATCVVILLGERPGLTAPDSLGAYVTWKPRPDTTEADRNCVSNIRPEGVRYADAARTIDTAGLVNRDLSQREFVATYGNRLDAVTREQKALKDAAVPRNEVEAQLAALKAENQAMRVDGQAAIESKSGIAVGLLAGAELALQIGELIAHLDQCVDRKRRVNAQAGVDIHGKLTSSAEDRSCRAPST